MKRLTLLLAASIFGLIGSDSAQAQFVYITNKASGLALTARSFPHGPGQILVQEPLTLGNPLQCWALRPVGNGAYQLVNPATGLALETLRGDSRTPVTLYPCRNVPTQFWWITPHRGTNHFALTPMLHDNRRLDVPGSTPLPSGIQIYKPNKTDAQRWSLIPVR